MSAIGHMWSNAGNLQNAVAITSGGGGVGGVGGGVVQVNTLDDSVVVSANITVTRAENGYVLRVRHLTEHREKVYLADDAQALKDTLFTELVVSRLEKK